MSVPQPTPDEARAALAEAAAAHSSVRSSDRYFGIALLLWVASYLAVMAIVSALQLNPLFVSLAAIPLALVGRWLSGRQRREQRAFTTAGKIAFYVTIAVFLLWTAILISWAVATGWLGADAGPRSFSLAVGAVVPVLTGGVVLARRA